MLSTYVLKSYTASKWQGMIVTQRSVSLKQRHVLHLATAGALKGYKIMFCIKYKTLAHL